MSRFSVGELIARTARDVHPPLFYLVLKAWTGLFGTQIVSMRLLPAITGGVSLIGVYLFARRLFQSPGLALLSAAAVASSCFQIRYAWEIRMYAQGAALCAFCHWAFVRACEPGAPFRRWLVWSGLAAAFAYTHYYSFFTLAAQFAYWLLSAASGKRLTQHKDARRDSPTSVEAVRRPASSTGVANNRNRILHHGAIAWILLVVFYSPWIGPFLRQRAEVQQAFWTFPMTAWTAPATVYQMFAGGVETDSFDREIERTASVACTIAVVSALVYLALRGNRGDRFLVWTGVLPFVLSAGVSWTSGRSVFVNRYFVFAHLSLMIALCSLVWKIPFRRVRGSAITALLIGNVLTTGRYVTELEPNRQTGARGAAEFLARTRRPDEPVIVLNSRAFFPILYYSGGRFEPALLNLPEKIEHFGGRQILTGEELLEKEVLQQLKGPSIWVVNSTGYGGVIDSPFVQWTPTKTWAFPELYWWQGEIIVQRYLRRGYTD